MSIEDRARKEEQLADLQKTGATQPSVRFSDLLKAGIAYGWSESTRRVHTSTSYLQRFIPRRTKGTASDRNRRIADRLEQEGSDDSRRTRSFGPMTPDSTATQGWVSR